MKPSDLVAGRFRIERAIGSGGMGVVYRVRDERTGAPAAVKILEIKTQVEAGRAQREVQALAQLRHPAIVGHIADGVLPDGRLYIAMDWIDGVTVAHRLSGFGFTPREVVQIARRIAGALAAAHDAGVLHRDVKPSNVLLPGGRVENAMLIDFGIARVTNSNVSLTRTGAAVGTPGYMSPEQARGERTTAPGIDVFGLGSTLYECATGQPAFTGATPVAILAKVVFSDVPPVHVVDSEIPKPLSELIEQMMKKSLSDRLRDCHAVLAVLDQIGPLDDSKRLATSPPVPTRRGRDAKVHCLIVASRGIPDEQNDPPDAGQIAQLEQAANLWEGEIELLETGTVCAHVIGEPTDATHRAARLALAFKRVLPGFSIALSAETPDVGGAAETSTALLTRSVMAAVFGSMPPGAIAVDPSTVKSLEPLFAVDRSTSIPQLVHEKKTVVPEGD